MRRMITEKEVEKLDSIKPSEIEKLGAMQDPKDAGNGYVLTATADGKAIYKPIIGGAKRKIKDGAFAWAASEFQDSSSFPGYKYASVATDHAVALAVFGLPFYAKADKSKVYIDGTDYILGLGESKAFLCIKTAAFEKFTADTAGMSNPKIFSGTTGYIQVI